jgi:Ser/Thr protein kinase RdoA (MazF antagonist)
VTEAGTVRRVATAFFTGVHGVRRFGGGHINETFLAETDSGDYVLQRINTAVFPDPDAVTANLLVVHRHVRGHGLPEPRAARDGSWLVHDTSGTWRAWRRVADAAPLDHATAGAASSAGELLGQFHGAVADLGPAAVVETLPHFHDPGRRLDALWTAVATDACGRVAGVERELECVRAAAPLAALATELHARLPRRIAHNDVKLDNVLFRAGRAVCLVDLDTVMPGAWFWDTGDLVRTAATTHAEDDPDATIDRQLHDAVLDGYRRAAGSVLEPDEADALEVAGAIVTFEQAVRFLTDWIAGDVYYRISRPRQNLERAQAQLRLLASMTDTVPYP